MQTRYQFPRFFQQNGAPLHSYNRTRAHLNRKRPNKWIERRGPVPWPARSPDIEYWDFFLWGHIKGMAYNTPVTSTEDLKTRIKREYRKLGPAVQEKFWNNLKLRLNVLENVRGARIERIMA